MWKGKWRLYIKGYEDWSSHIVFVTFCFMGTLAWRKKTCCDNAGNIKEFDLPTIDITILVSYKLKMIIFKGALVIKEHAWFAFLFVQTVLLTLLTKHPDIWIIF